VKTNKNELKEMAALSSLEGFWGNLQSPELLEILNVKFKETKTKKTKNRLLFVIQKFERSQSTQKMMNLSSLLLMDCTTEHLLKMPSVLLEPS